MSELITLADLPPDLVVDHAAATVLGEGQRIWGTARQELFRAGLDHALEQRLRNTGTAGYDTAEGLLMLDGDLVAEDLAAGSPVMTAVAVAAGRQLKVRSSAAVRRGTRRLQ